MTSANRRNSLPETSPITVGTAHPPVAHHVVELGSRIRTLPTRLRVSHFLRGGYRRGAAFSRGRTPMNKEALKTKMRTHPALQKNAATKINLVRQPFVITIKYIVQAHDLRSAQTRIVIVECR
jgi:hypothetical protein